MKEICNAKIIDTKITMEDHGCLTFWLILEGSGWGVGFGGYCIGHGYLDADEFKATSGDGLEAIMMIMDVVGVERWENLKGKLIRAELEDHRCHCIGNIMENKWFDIEKFFNSKKEVQNEQI